MSRVTKSTTSQKRSRGGCHRCKKLKIKCDELKPHCSFCIQAATDCDYSIKLIWGGRPYSKPKKLKNDYSDVKLNISNPDARNTKKLVFINDEVKSADGEGPDSVKSIIESPSSDLIEDIPRSYMTEFNLSDDFSSTASPLPHTPSTLFGEDDIDSDFDLVMDTEQAVIKPKPDYEMLLSIPKSLLLLPDILLNVPYYRELFHFWLTKTCHMFVIDPKTIRGDNPFQTVVPRLAMKTPALMTTLLSLTAVSRAVVLNHDIPKARVDRLLKETLLEFNNSIHDEENTFGNLATLLMLQAYEIIFKTNLSDFTEITKSATSIILRGKNWISKKNNRAVIQIKSWESEESFFLLRWFAYSDVISSLSKTRVNKKLAKQKNPNIEEVEDIDYDIRLDSLSDFWNLDPNASFNLGGSKVDEFLWFDLKFVPYFSKIASLVKKSQEYYDNYQRTVPIEIIKEALELKQDLENYYNVSTIDHDLEGNLLLTTNQIYYYMGLIILHKRILQIPRESHIIQSYANTLVSLYVDKLKDNYTARLGCIFGFFVGSCELLNEGLRKEAESKFLEILTENKNISMFNACYRLLKLSWDTGKDWYDIAYEMNIDFVSF